MLNTHKLHHYKENQLPCLIFSIIIFTYDAKTQHRHISGGGVRIKPQPLEVRYDPDLSPKYRFEPP